MLTLAILLSTLAIGQSPFSPFLPRAVPDAARLSPPNQTAAVESTEHLIGTIQASSNAKTTVWILPSELRLDTRKLTDGKSLYFTGPPATYRLWEVAVNADSKGEPQTFERTVTIKPAVPIPPKPGPNPPAPPQPQVVSVPNVIGQDVANATAQIKSLGLRWAIVIETSDKPANQVISQNPIGGVLANVGDVVGISVSDGPKPPPAPEPPKPPAPGKYGVAPLVFELAMKLPADAKLVCPAVATAFAGLSSDIGSGKIGLLAVAGETRKRLDAAYGSTSRSAFLLIESSAIAKLKPQLKLNAANIAEAYLEISNGMAAVK